jgi:4a-hydroxytetrahydrobiopterin dehydratase
MKKDRQRTQVTRKPADPPLAERSCEACRNAKEPMASERAAALLWQLDGWACKRGHHLAKRWQFDDFAQALAFVDRVGALAESQGHHPDLFLRWGEVRAEIYTHSVGGLTEADFILAAKIDRVPLARKA